MSGETVTVTTWWFLKMTLLPNYEFFESANLPVVGGTDFTASSDATPLTITAINSGSGAIGSAKNGNLRLTGAATTDNSGANVQATLAKFVPAAGANARFEAYVQLSTTAVEFLTGLVVVDTSIMASAPADGIYLYKAEGATGAWSILVRSGSSTIATIPLTVAATTNLQKVGIELKYDDFTLQTVSITAWVDGAQVAQQTVTGLSSTAPTLVPSAEMMSGSATGTQTFDIDLWRWVFTRT